MKGGGGLNLFTEIWHHIDFSSNQKMVSVLHKELGHKVETQAYVERGIAAKDQNKSELLAYE